MRERRGALLQEKQKAGNILLPAFLIDVVQLV